MECRQSLILCVVYTLFLIFGAAIFMYIESEVFIDTEIKEPKEWQRMKERPTDEEELLVLATWLPKVCPNISNSTIQNLIKVGPQLSAIREAERVCPELHQETEIKEILYRWSFIDSLSFCMTVATTIGYGMAYPITVTGRIVVILYAMVGIPLTGMLLAWTSDFFGEQLFRLFKAKLSTQKQHSKKIIAMCTFFYIAVGFVVFIFIPAGIFTVIEEWTYIDSVYFAFITLTTIGFGDMVAGTETAGWQSYIYHIGIILWIMIGLGYWVMVANFITKALKSKKLQSSVLRSAEEMKKLMHQMGLKNHDPRFLRQHSKATLNFMLQLSNMIAVHGGVENSELGDSTDSPSTSSPTSPTSPMGIPGISALFGPGMNHAAPFSQLIGPLSKRVILLHRESMKKKKKKEEEKKEDEFDSEMEITTIDDVSTCDETEGSVSMSPTTIEKPDDNVLCNILRKTSSESQTTLQLEEST